LTDRRAPTAVLDTNVVLDWLVFNDPGVAAVAAAIASGSLRWIASARMRAELAHVAARPPLAARGAAADRLLEAVERHAGAPCSEPAPCRLVCTDADDQVFIDLALAHGARWLLTRDKALLKLARKARPLGTTICTPAGWTG
jgi:predicted nucleic acid-binding protein